MVLVWPWNIQVTLFKSAKSNQRDKKIEFGLTQGLRIDISLRTEDKWISLTQYPLVEGNQGMWVWKYQRMRVLDEDISTTALFMGGIYWHFAIDDIEIMNWRKSGSFSSFWCGSRAREWLPFGRIFCPFFSDVSPPW